MSSSVRPLGRAECSPEKGLQIKSITFPLDTLVRGIKRTGPKTSLVSVLDLEFHTYTGEPARPVEASVWNRCLACSVSPKTMAEDQGALPGSARH